MDALYSESGKLLKMEVDYSSTVEEKIPICEELTKNGRLNEALEILISLEKQARTGGDTHSTTKILVTIAKLCFESKAWDLLNENVQTLAKRRSQMKQAITKMIQQCCEFVDQMPDKETQLKFIDTLRTVTAGKIYVEVERARLTHKLALMREKEGKVVEAANLLSELQVETFNSMERREKVELILEQIRFGLANKDYIGTRIVSEKIQTRFFEDAKHQDLKLKYYRLMIELDLHESKYLSICKHYRAVYNTPSIQANVSEKQFVLKHVILYIILAAYNNEQSDLIHRISLEKYLEEVPKYNELLRLFSTAELISWASLVSNFESTLRVGSSEDPATEVFAKTEEGEKRWKDLKSRVVEHNIRIMSKYYQRISIQRMSELLNLSIPETEEVMSNLVVEKQVWAKVDRLQGIVNFTPTQHPNEVLNDWSNNINKLMASVCKVNHLINKEQMIHQSERKTVA